jgi:hypothetical protein
MFIRKSLEQTLEKEKNKTCILRPPHFSQALRFPGLLNKVTEMDTIISLRRHFYSTFKQSAFDESMIAISYLSIRILSIYKWLYSPLWILAAFSVS